LPCRHQTQHNTRGPSLACLLCDERFIPQHRHPSAHSIWRMGFAWIWREPVLLRSWQVAVIQGRVCWPGSAWACPQGISPKPMPRRRVWTSRAGEAGKRDEKTARLAFYIRYNAHMSFSTHPSITQTADLTVPSRPCCFRIVYDKCPGLANARRLGSVSLPSFSHRVLPFPLHSLGIPLASHDSHFAKRFGGVRAEVSGVA